MGLRAQGLQFMVSGFRDSGFIQTLSNGILHK